MSEGAASPGAEAAASAGPDALGRTDWDRIPDKLRACGLRWTPQRGTLLTVLARTDGHVTGSQLVERCRELDPATTPSTVYRTLDVLEELGVVSHSHGIDGREEFHVLPTLDHGHLICSTCGAEEELPAADAAPFLGALRRERGFEAEIGHLTVMGRCRVCAETGANRPAPASSAATTT
ncbi:MAG: transcriptional repressor [Anaerolinea sp.]|nr:transcriptional repressor [Anaerolinea sp.]